VKMIVILLSTKHSAFSILNCSPVLSDLLMVLKKAVYYRQCKDLFELKACCLGHVQSC
jgi:hypothetical protein